MSPSVARIMLPPAALLAAITTHLPVATANPVLDARSPVASTNTLTSDDAASIDSNSPLSIAPSYNWDGFDGTWSSFNVRVGTPPQPVRLFHSWASAQPWVVLPSGCDNTTNPSACSATRGGAFAPANSSSWSILGTYDLGIDESLGYSGQGTFGDDSVVLDTIAGDVATVKNTTVGGLIGHEYYLGMLGLNPQSSNLADTKAASAPSFLSLLQNQQHIPSKSFGYTAGAIYREVFASLTLGGYDAARVVENDLSFALDNSAASSGQSSTRVTLQSIATNSEKTTTSTPLLSDAIDVALDATSPQIWLPTDVCDVFEREFGLTYDAATDLYLVNSATHQTLQQRNPNVTFQISDSSSSKDSVSIVLPYAAFDLLAHTPYQGLAADSRYFPLRRALNDSQYTLGRAFFQEAYISVDFDAQTFNLSQVDWSSGSNSNIVALTPAAAASPAGTLAPEGHATGLSSGELAGIISGGLAVLALIGLFIAWLRRPRRTPIPSDDDEENVKAAFPMKEKPGNRRAAIAAGKTPVDDNSSAGGPEVTVIPRAERNSQIRNSRMSGYPARSRNSSGTSSAARSPSRRASSLPFAPKDDASIIAGRRRSSGSPATSGASSVARTPVRRTSPRRSVPIFAPRDDAAGMLNSASSPALSGASSSTAARRRSSSTVFASSSPETMEAIDEVPPSVSAPAAAAARSSARRSSGVMLPPPLVATSSAGQSRTASGSSSAPGRSPARTPVRRLSTGPIVASPVEVTASDTQRSSTLSPRSPTGIALPPPPSPGASGLIPVNTPPPVSTSPQPSRKSIPAPSANLPPVEAKSRLMHVPAPIGPFELSTAPRTPGGPVPSAISGNSSRFSTGGSQPTSVEHKVRAITSPPASQQANTHVSSSGYRRESSQPVNLPSGRTIPATTVLPSNNTSPNLITSQRDTYHRRHGAGSGSGEASSSSRAPPAASGYSNSKSHPIPIQAHSKHPSETSQASTAPSNGLVSPLASSPPAGPLTGISAPSPVAISPPSSRPSSYVDMVRSRQRTVSDGVSRIISSTTSMPTVVASGSGKYSSPLSAEVVGGQETNRVNERRCKTQPRSGARNGGDLQEPMKEGIMVDGRLHPAFAFEPPDEGGLI